MQRPTRNGTQGRNFLFQRSDLNQRIPSLFETWRRTEIKCSNSSSNLSSQSNLFCKQLFENTCNSNITPLVEKIHVKTPKAPVKFKKQVKKGDLRPKKLQYSDDELDNSSTNTDSGINVQFDQSNDTFHKQRATKCNRLDSLQSQMRRLRAKLDKIKMQTDDKENDKSIVENSRNNIVRESVVFNPNAEVLSQCDDNLDWREKLYWLQPRRDIGLWIECCRKKCKKWRYVEDYHDPVDVPKIWYCEINSDKSIASCDIPEHSKSQAIKTDLIENDYNAGSIVWAHIKGYPWWPGIVNDCPETCTYYKLSKNSLKPNKYYVTFFNKEKLESNWISKQNIKSFKTNKYTTLIKKTKFNGIDYKKSLQEAYEMATSTLSLSILERLRRFSFLALQEKFYDINNNSSQIINNNSSQIINNNSIDISSNMDTNSDDEIPCSKPKKRQYTLKEYYLDVICKNQR